MCMHVPPLISVGVLLARAAASPQPPSRAGPSLAIHPEATQTQGHPALDPDALLALGYPPVGSGSPYWLGHSSKNLWYHFLLMNFVYKTIGMLCGVLGGSVHATHCNPPNILSQAPRGTEHLKVKFPSKTFKF